MSYYSIDKYVGDGVTTDYAVTFEYASRDSIRAIQSSPSGDVTLDRTVDLIWIDSGTVRLVPATPNGHFLNIKRGTDKVNPAADYTDNSVLTDNNLDTSISQVLSIVQELKDLLEDTTTYSVSAKALSAAASLSVGAVQDALTAKTASALELFTAAGLARDDAQSVYTASNAILTQSEAAAVMAADAVTKANNALADLETIKVSLALVGIIIPDELVPGPITYVISSALVTLPGLATWGTGASGGGTYVVGSNYYYGASAWSNDEGANWRDVELSGPIAGICFTGTEFLSIYKYTGTTVLLKTLPDDHAWTETPLPALNDYSFTSIEHGNGTTVLFHESPEYSQYSNDNITFSQVSTFPSGWGNQYATTYGSGKFLAIQQYMQGPQVALSTDGHYWSVVQLGSGINNISSVASNGTTFVAVSQGSYLTGYASNQCIHSMDGENWVESVMPTARQWTCIDTFLNGKFIAVAGDFYAISDDGVNWTEYAAPASIGSNHVVGSDLGAIVLGNVGSTQYRVIATPQ